MGITLITLILLAFALLAGIGLIIGAVIAYRDHRVMGIILAVAGVLVILCPIALYVIVLISTQSM
jgi:hypothetical protein